MLRKALLQRPPRPVIYVSRKTPHAWVFRPNAKLDGHDVVPFMKRDLEGIDELDDPRTVYISDSLEPLIVPAFTIMITSPRRSRGRRSKPCTARASPMFLRPTCATGTLWAAASPAKCSFTLVPRWTSKSKGRSPRWTWRPW